MTNIQKSLRYVVVIIGLGSAGGAWAQTPAPVIEPQIDRRDVSVPKISARDIEVSAYTGILSVEDFGAESSSGFRIGYHITEDFFVEATYGTSTVSDQSFFDRGIPIFTERNVELEYYYASLGVNLFPGEVFIGRNWAMTSAVYLTGGIGNVSFADQDQTAYNLGIGIRVLPWDWLSFRFEVRDHIFESDLLGKKEFKHNFEMTLGIGAYF
jgi:outer membrane beta-barrel protein